MKIKNKIKEEEEEEEEEEDRRKGRTMESMI